MIWKAKYTKETYPPGTTRVKRVFPWLPFEINGDMVWLEFYEIFQLYVERQYQTNVDEKPMLFKFNEWVNLSYRTITK